MKSSNGVFYLFILFLIFIPISPNLVAPISSITPPPMLLGSTTDSPFPPNKLWFLNRFRSGFLEPWCYLVNQPAFPPVLSGTIVMKDASSTEGVAQCTLNLENDTPTDVITVRKENLLFFGSSWEPTFRVPNQFIFGRNAPNGSKLGARTGTEPVPCWWKRAIRPRPWRHQLGSSDPESDTPSPSRILSPICCNSRCPRNNCNITIVMLLHLMSTDYCARPVEDRRICYVCSAVIVSYIVQTVKLIRTQCLSFPAHVFQIHMKPCTHEASELLLGDFLNFAVGYRLSLTSSVYAKLTSYANMETEPVHAHTFNENGQWKMGIFPKNLSAPLTTSMSL